MVRVIWSLSKNVERFGNITQVFFHFSNKMVVSDQEYIAIIILKHAKVYVREYGLFAVSGNIL